MGALLIVLATFCSVPLYLGLHHSKHAEELQLYDFLRRRWMGTTDGFMFLRF
jgi:hypothetical protein